MDQHRVPILMYHSVSIAAGPRFAPFAVTPDEFESQMSYLGTNGYTALTVNELARAYAGFAPLPPKPVVLTFDDGFCDFLFNAMPSLLRHSLRATLYFVSGCVGGTSSWLASIGEGARPLLDWSQIAQVAQTGIVEIGAHTVTHRPLDALSREAALEEIESCRRVIESRLGRAVGTFAYPFGFETAQLRQMVREAGYSAACAVRYATSTAQNDRFALPRHIVRRGTDLAAFERILSDAVPSLSVVVDRARSRTYAALRPLLRTLAR